MVLRIFYLAVFLAGLALAVHSMLHGAERWRRKRSGKASAVLNPPTVAAMAVGFGLSGYLLVTRSSLGTIAIAIISAIMAAGLFSGMTILMAKWALRTSPDALHGEENDVSGQVATVSRTIAPHEPGEIRYFAWEAEHILPAQSLDGTVIPQGTEVVIDQIEDGIAQVELWSVVEQRL